MGRERVVDKTLRPLTTGVTSITPAQATGGRATNTLGIIPIGNYKGAAAFFDLDKMANQPLAWAEQLHILGVLDGREEDYDLQTLTTVVNEGVGTPHIAALTVPAGEVWYVHCVQTVVPASGGANVITANWRCSLWTDRAVVPNPVGQAFHAVDLNFGVGGGTQWDEFGVIPLLWLITNKPQTLRLPAGSILTVIFTNMVAPAAAVVTCLFRVYGYIGKALVA